MRSLGLGVSLARNIKRERGKAEISVQLHLTRLDATHLSQREIQESIAPAIVSSYRDLSSMNHFVDVRIDMYFVAKEWARIQTFFIAEYSRKLYRVI